MKTMRISAKIFAHIASEGADNTNDFSIFNSPILEKKLQIYRLDSNYHKMSLSDCFLSCTETKQIGAFFSLLLHKYLIKNVFTTRTICSSKENEIILQITN